MEGCTGINGEKTATKTRHKQKLDALLGVAQKREDPFAGCLRRFGSIGGPKRGGWAWSGAILVVDLAKAFAKDSAKVQFRVVWI